MVFEACGAARGQGQYAGCGALHSKRLTRRSMLAKLTQTHDACFESVGEFDVIVTGEELEAVTS